MTVSERPLGLILNVLEQMGLDISYAYDDLVFVENNTILLQMESVNKEVSFFFNEDLYPEERPALQEKLINAGKNEGLSFSYKGLYSIKAEEDEMVSIKFKPENTF